MPLRRANVRRTIIPAIVLVGLVLVLHTLLPAPESLDAELIEEASEARRSARSQLERELAISKPRDHIGVTAESRRAVQTTNVAGEKANFGERPLQNALRAYLRANSGLNIGGTELPGGRKWLLYTPGVVGWGNRLQGMYLALATSLVTNRTLIVDWTSPVRLDELVRVTTEFPLLLPSSLRPALAKMTSRNANAWEHPKKYMAFPTDILRDQDMRNWKEEVVNFSAGEDWLEYLLQNQYLRDDIMRVFGTTPQHSWTERSLQLVAHELLDFLVKDMSPAARLMLERSAIYPSYRDGVSTIGIQIRIGTNNTSFDPFVDLQKDAPKFWSCANALLKTKSSSRHPWKIFLATDSIDVKEQAKAHFGDHLLFFDGPIVHSGNEQVTDESGKDRSIDGLLKVVVDWWLLGESQYLFRSRQSTFGRSAAIRRPTPSLVLPTEFIEGCPLPGGLH